MNLAVAGGSLGISGSYNKSKSKTEGTEFSDQISYECCYNQEEKISVPPGKHVKAKITVYSMKYEMGYTLKFSVNRNTSLPLIYNRMGCQSLFGAHVQSCSCT